LIIILILLLIVGDRWKSKIDRISSISIKLRNIL